MKYVTVKRFVELTGYTAQAIYNKIHEGVWMEGREYRKAPDNRTLIDLEGYEKWVEGQRAA